MNIRSKINLVSFFVLLLVLGNFLQIDFKKPLLFQFAIVVSIVLIQLLILYFFYQGRNWARVLIIIGSILTLVFGIFPALNQPNIFFKLIYFLEWLFALYLVIFLNSKEAKEFFKPNLIAQENKSLSSKVLLISFIIVGVIGGGVFIAIQTLKDKVKNMDIYVEDNQSGKFYPITNEGRNLHPRFSYDGQKIIYSYIPNSGKSYSEIRTYSVLTMSTTSLLKVNESGFNLSACLSPDSSKVLYIGNENNKTDLWVYSLTDNSRTQLTTDKEVEIEPLCSPDGKWIAFFQNEEGKQKELFIIPSGGGPKKQLTNTTSFLYTPEGLSWSPDSTEIAYISFGSLFLINTEGKLIQQFALTGLNNFDFTAFSPSNPEHIIFTARTASSVSLNRNLYILSRKDRSIKLWKERGITEVGYSFSPNGLSFAYSKIRQG